MLYIASDHAGFHLKKIICNSLTTHGVPYTDMGAATENPNDDYPDFILQAAKKVAENPEQHRGIILGGSGQGEAIAANKVQGIRAIVYYGEPNDIITLSREHNNANILSLGARFLTDQQACDAVTQWLKTKFSGDERHVRRIQKITSFEKHNESNSS